MAKLLYARSCIALAVTATLAACGSSSSDDNDNTGNGSTGVALITTQVTGQGTITPSSVEIPISSSTTLQVSASENHQLDSISGCNGEINSSETQYAITNISGDCTVSAVFVENDDEGDGNGDTGGGNTGGGLQGDNLTVGRSDMSFSAYLVQDDLSPLDITISTENPGERSGSFSLDLSGLDDDAWVLVRAQGGSQLDPDYTGEYTSYIATPDAEIFTLARVSDWNSGANVSAVGDVVWRLSEEWVGKLNLDEFSSRVQRVVDALGDGSDWGYESVLGWSMTDRRNLDANESAQFVRHQFSDTGSLLKGADPTGFGYQYYIDSFTESFDMQDHASTVAGPGITPGFSGTGSQSTLITFSATGPSVTESSLTEFEFDLDTFQGKAVVERGMQSHTITAIEDEDEGRVFVAWDGCPNIIDRLTCEFNGLRSHNITAQFEYNYAEFVDGYQAFMPHVKAEEIDENTVLILGDSLLAEDIKSLEALESGGFMGLYTPDLHLISKVHIATQDSDGNWIVTHEQVPFDEVFLAGTFPIVDLGTNYTFEDQDGNTVTLSANDLMNAVQNRPSRYDKPLLDISTRENGFDMKALFTAIELTSSGDINVSHRRSGLHLERAQRTLQVDIYLDSEFSLRNELAILIGAYKKYEWPSKGSSSSSNSKFRLTKISGGFWMGVPITFDLNVGPKFKSEMKIEARLPTYESGFIFEDRRGVSVIFSLRDGIDAETSISRGVVSSYGNALDEDLYEGAEAKTSFTASAGFEGRLDAGISGLNFLYGRVKPGLSAHGVGRIGSEQNLNAKCNPVEVDLSAFFLGEFGVGLNGLVGEILKSCALCNRVASTQFDDMPLAGFRGERSIFNWQPEVNEELCEGDNLLVDINWPEEIEITSTRAPGLSGHTFSNLLRLPGGEWMFEDDFLESLAEMGYDSTEALRVKNTLDEDTIPLWMSLEVNFTDDNLFNWMESPLSLTPSPGLNDSFYRTRDSYLMEPLSVETLGIGINPNLSNTSSLTFNRLSGKSFDFLYTIKDKTQGVEEEEATEVLFTLTHKQPPLIPGRTTYAYRGTNGANQDVKRFAVELTLPSYFENDPRFASLIQAVTVEMRVNGELVSTEPLAEVEFVEGKPLIHGFVNRSGRSGEAFGDRVEITVHYGWDYERQEHTVSRRIAFPPCELDDNDEYDCSLNYSGRWITD